VIIKSIPSKSHSTILIGKVPDIECPVTWMTLKPHVSKDEQYLFLNNLRILRVIDHPNVTKFYGILDSDQNILVEYCEGLDLRYFVRDSPWDRIWEMLIQTTNALVYLHSNNIIHNDITLRNVLVTNDGIKIRGFGLSVLTNEKERAKVQFVPFYTAPERIRDGVSSQHSDVYSFGCMLYEAGHRNKKIAFRTEDDVFHTCERILGGEKLVLPPNWPTLYCDIIRACTLPNPDSRLSLFKLRDLLIELKESNSTIPEEEFD